MSFFNKMERKFGKYAIRNLTTYIIITYMIGYFIYYLYPQLLQYLSLDPTLIFKGQVWRIITWIFIPPAKPGILTIVMLFFYYSIGGTLERTWGAFRYNVYILGGILITIIGALIFGLVLGRSISLLGAFNTYYISMSILFGYALTYPDHQIMLYFIIPLKVKWLAVLYLFTLAVDVMQNGWVARIGILCSLLNVGIYFIISKRQFSPKEMQRKRKFAKAVHQGQQASKITKHKCAVCGQTDSDDANLEFRFCSKCNGNYEYCNEHLFTHEHIR